MTDSFDNDVQVAESCEGKIKFSAICKALKEGGIDFDVPGCLLAADAEGAVSKVELDKENEFNSQVFRMAGNACSRLVANAMMVEPNAWAVLAEWHARNLHAKAKREALSDLLAEL
jgi:hypothetical protein